jgi:acyl-homoserine-lactone acylase
VATAGDAYALAVEFGETPRAFSVIPYSAASNPKSPYYNNQLEIYAAEKFKPAWFSEQDIKDHLDRQYRPGQ